VPGGQDWTIRSSHLPAPVPCFVLTPPSYAASRERRYPLLLFLHDGQGDERSLVRHGIAADLSRRMREGSLPEIVVVSPGAPGSWFSDFHDGSQKWETFLTGDLLREVESGWRVRSDREGRGVTGISMGGYGAVKLGLRRPDLFATASGLSAALTTLSYDDVQGFPWFVRRDLLRVFGNAPGDNSFAENDVWEILAAAPESPRAAFELVSGTEDSYQVDRLAARFGARLVERGFDARVVLTPGGHDWDYWRRAMPEVVLWHARRFSYDGSSSPAAQGGPAARATDTR
jgi:S-formylglutathione hydrolase FrmB